MIKMGYADGKLRVLRDWNSEIKPTELDLVGSHFQVTNGDLLSACYRNSCFLFEKLEPPYYSFGFTNDFVFLVKEMIEQEKDTYWLCEFYSFANEQGEI